MADISIGAWSLPFTPNSGIALYDTDAPQVIGYMEANGGSIPAPKIISLSPTMSVLEMSFDQPVATDTPSIVAGPAGSPIVSGTSQINVAVIDINYTIPKRPRQSKLNVGEN